MIEDQSANDYSGEFFAAQVADGVCTLTLSNPPRKNAISPGMVDEVVALLDTLRDREDVCAVVLTGEGSAFCAGAELASVARASEEPDVAREAVRNIYKIFLAVADCPILTIAAVNGPAVGAGLNLALSCDLIVCSTEAQFISKFLSLGLHPGGGHTWMLRSLISAQAAAALVLASETIDGPEAERIGLAWKCVSADDLLTEATRLGSRATRAPRELLIAAKASIREMSSIFDRGDAVDLELEKQLYSAQQPAFQERVGSAAKK
jgi:enoyl-CoA hydratase